MRVRGFYGKKNRRPAKRFDMNKWLRFFAWYLSEGCIRRRGGEPTAVYISQKDKKNIEEIKRTVKDLGFNFYEHFKEHDGTTTIEISNNHLANYLAQFGLSNEKHIPEQIKGCSKKQLELFWRTMLKGDGYVSRQGTEYYHSNSKRLIDDLQEIVMKIGKAGTVCVDNHRENTCYYISVGHNVDTTINPKSQRKDGIYKWVKYDGTVYCCTVPTGIIMVRKNGKAGWSGNTMGEYGAPLTGRPLFEGLFPADATIKWDGREWSMGGEITPRDPVSMYHASKVADSFNVYEACKYWWLRSYDVMQGVIYGVHTDELAKDERLRTRFDLDEWFGTVMNRFITQAIAGIPLTVYGSGEQIRGFTALEDAMDCMVRLISSPPEAGQYDVVNQVSGLHKVGDLAETVATVASQKFGIPVKIQRLENPRVEAEEHPLEVVSSKLPNTFGFTPRVTPEKEITRVMELLTKDEIKRRILEKKHCIVPKTTWRGDKVDPDVLETYEPGTKDSRGYQGRLDTE